jgi:spectinomycin phosphotransferase
MREPPSLIGFTALVAAIETAYDLAVTRLEFLPLGHDSSSWVYRLQSADGGAQFVKLRAGPLNEASLRVPRLLRAAGVTGIIAPLPARDGSLWACAGPYTLILYPFLEASSGMATGLSDVQWRAYGAVLRQIHSTAVPPELAALMRREEYSPPGADTIRKADAALTQASPADTSGRELAAFWEERRDVILALLLRAEELGRELARREPPLVLCHADVHTGNVLGDSAGGVWIVDWDETLLAPKERDLMFVVGGISRKFVDPRQEALCLEGYGPAPIDRDALAYYRYAWAVSDIAAYSADLLFRPDLGPVARAEAMAGLRVLFQPGEIVGIAYESDGKEDGLSGASVD